MQLAACLKRAKMSRRANSASFLLLFSVLILLKDELEIIDKHMSDSQKEETFHV